MKKLIAEGVYKFEVVGELPNDELIRDIDNIKELIQNEFDESLREDTKWKVNSDIELSMEVSEIEK